MLPGARHNEKSNIMFSSLLSQLFAKFFSGAIWSLSRSRVIGLKAEAEIHISRHTSLNCGKRAKVSISCYRILLFLSLEQDGLFSMFEVRLHRTPAEIEQ